MPGKGSPIWALRLRKTLKFYVVRQAARKHMTASAYVRKLIENDLRQQAKIRGVLHPDFSRLDRAVKWFILHSQGIHSAILHGKVGGDQLEGLCWKVLEEAVAYAKTQEDPNLRLLAMGLAMDVLRAELVGHEMDQASVDELVAKVEGDRAELWKRARESERAREAPAPPAHDQKPQAGGAVEA